MNGDIKIILKKSFHERIIIIILYLEYISRFKLFFKIIRKILLQGIYHVEIAPSIFCNKNAIVTLRMPHPFGIVIHGNAKIESDVTIFHRVTLGVVEKNDMVLLAPILKKGAYIGTGTVILGACVIGENAKIGANSTILKSVGDNKTAFGIWK